jgi:glycosyltransferase involved in cell wall biosynthesis
LRIGITAHNYPPYLGGLEVLVRELTRRFAREHEVVVVTTAWEGRSGVAVEDGATIHRLPAWHGAARRGVPYAVPVGPGLRAAYNALRSCDVIHAHGSLYLTTILAALARRPQAPLVLTEHVGFVPYASTLLTTAQRIAWATIGSPIVRRSYRVITYNSRVHEALAARFGLDRMSFIANGVDTSRFRPSDAVARRAARARLGLPANDVLALFVGRDSPKKNLDAVLRFPEAGYRLVVCGAERALPPKAINLGSRPHEAMPDVFAAADFLLHAAEGEGFPLTVQEAMAAGLPVALLWDSGYAGSVDPGAVIAAGSLADLSRAARSLAENAVLRDQQGLASRAYAAQHWNWDVTIERHLDIFRDALRQSS